MPLIIHETARFGKWLSKSERSNLFVLSEEETRMEICHLSKSLNVKSQNHTSDEIAFVKPVSKPVIIKDGLISFPTFLALEKRT